MAKVEVYGTEFDTANIPENLHNKLIALGLATCLRNIGSASRFSNDPEVRKAVMRRRYDELKAGQWKSSIDC